MSWVQWLGEQWETTPDEAELHLHLWQPEAMCPRSSWSLRMRHAEYAASADPRKLERWLDVEIGELHFRERDWRKLAGLEIRADAAWHAEHEYCHEYGSLVESSVTAHTIVVGNTKRNPEPVGKRESWRGLGFILRLGARDGFGFSCELDAWLMPESEFWRTTPETPGELARFAEGPPQLRVVTRAVFTGGDVNVTRAEDPLPLARRYLREEAALAEMHDPHIEWAVRRILSGAATEQMPGWTSTVAFKTRPRA